MSAVLPAIFHHLADAGNSILKNAGPFVAAIAVSKLALDSWRKTLGRRRRWMRLYRQVSVGLQVEYVFELFGKAAYKRLAHDGEGNEVTEYVWPLATDGYLQAVADAASTVRQYSLTTSSKLFCPRLKMGIKGSSGTFRVRLGKTRFAEIAEDPTYVYLACGASFYEYAEDRYMGRPGKYIDWICSHSLMGIGNLEAIPIDMPYDREVPRPPRRWHDNLSDAQKEIVEGSRMKTVINTIAVSDLPPTSVGDISFGPRCEVVDRKPH